MLDSKDEEEMGEDDHCREVVTDEDWSTPRARSDSKHRLTNKREDEPTLPQ
jgi:hypothetical protein